MAELSEFELIRRFFTHPTRHTQLGVGDDAAVVRVRRGMELAVSTDMLLSGRHFFRDADPRGLGHKALAVNLSDMAAMGATPRWATLSLALPKAEAPWLRAFADGFMQLARKHGVDLIGGDTTRGPLAICVQIMGEISVGQALRRAGARVGDDIWVSGHLGDAALALAALTKRIMLKPPELETAMRRLHAPAPRVALGEALRKIANSAIDVSDGLLADLGHICERSRVAAVLEFERLPASAVMRRYLERRVARAALLAGGDDYELCFSASPARHRAILAIARRIGLTLTRIGTVRRAVRGAPLVTVLALDGTPMNVKYGGFEHFR
ncbi:MAG: thiamine-phosphate kinase [Betaproteobacteria bacterium RIFCSPLOWO2_12_FULL_62_13]|nr:MAG: thiamine-phosphate kinase [Betaproteobacteria bacterium RIFCSPLOWO2_12_FULL_62_13]